MTGAEEGLFEAGCLGSGLCSVRVYCPLIGLNGPLNSSSLSHKLVQRCRAVQCTDGAGFVRWPVFSLLWLRRFVSSRGYGCEEA